MKRATVSLLFFLAATLAGSATWSCSRDSYPGDPEPVSIGMIYSEASSLVYIAEERGFLAANGIGATLKHYDDGTASLNALLNGEVDIARSAEYPLVVKALRKGEIKILASIDKYDYMAVVGRKDKGIENVSDLKGRRVGVPRQTVGDFYLGRFLSLHGMSMQDVVLVNLSWPRSVDSVMNGEVDAVLIYPPYRNLLEARLGTNASVWPAQSGQQGCGLVLSTDNWIAKNRETISRFMESLLAAEMYVRDRPEDAKAVIKKRLKYDDAYIETVWQQNQFSLSLDRSLVVAMEDEARWMIDNNFTAEKTIPDFLNYVHLDGIKAIKPHAVNIIR